MPKDNEGNDIDNIVGYEILRGSRNGNKTILAKGIINNFRNYSIQGTPENDQGGAPTIGLYANYPYNCLIPRSNTTIAQSVLGVLQADYFYNDPFIIRRSTGADGIDAESRLSQNIPIDIQSFHSPDLSYNNPTSASDSSYFKRIFAFRYLKNLYCLECIWTFFCYFSNSKSIIFKSFYT